MKLEFTIENNEITFYRGVLNSINDTQKIKFVKLESYVDFLLNKKRIEYPLEYYRQFINNLPKQSSDTAILTREDL